MNNIIKDRVNKAQEIDAEIEKQQRINTKRTRALGDSSESLDKKLKYLEDIRKTLPPKRMSQAAGKDVAFWAGGTFKEAITLMMNPFKTNYNSGDIQPANFVVTHQGVIIANQAVIRGTGYFNDGVFNGTVYATDGKFTGDIYSENAYIRGEIHATSGTFNGKVTSNSNGNRIEIDSETRTIKMIDKFGSVLVEMGFYEYGDDTGAEIVYKSYDADRNISSSMRILGGSISLYHGDVGQSRNYASIFHDGKIRFSLDPDQMPNRNEAYDGQTYLDGETIKLKRQ